MGDLHNEQQLFEQLRAGAQHDGTLMYVGRLLARAAEQYANSIALIYKDESITFAQLYARTCEFAKILQKQGVKPGDRVLLCFENVPEFYIGYYAILQLGAVVVPLNTFLRGAELAHIVNDAQPRLIVASIVLAESFAQDPDIKIPTLLTQEDMPQEQSGSIEAAKIVDRDHNALAVLLYTSGTTGVPKGVMLTSRNIMTNVLQGVSRINITKNERVFGVLPLFHSFAQCACVWGAMFVGAAVILAHKIERRAILNALRHKPTIFLGVPALYGMLCLLRNAPVSSVDYFVSGGDALPDRISMAFELLYHRKISSGYGLTETSPLIAVEFSDELLPANTVGAPCIGIDIEVRDDTGGICAPGEIGELWVRGDNVMLGYYRAQEMTDAIIKDGWLNTGDLVYLDEKGRIVITGRLKDLIIHKGFNIYPQEIENVMTSHPNVLRVGIIGQKDDATGEVPIAYVQLRKADDNAEQALRRLCKQQLAPYKTPKVFICGIEELPTTATGKVDKKMLRKWRSTQI